jgi:hypothetical protein
MNSASDVNKTIDDPFNELDSFADRKINSGEAALTMTKHLLSNEVHI